MQDKRLSVFAGNRSNLKIECYNKREESPRGEAETRFEIRLMKQKSTSEAVLVREARALLAPVLSELPAVLQELNASLLKQWHETAGAIRWTEFVRTNHSLIFQRKQLVALLEQMGIPNARKAADRFRERNPAYAEYISKTQLRRLIQHMQDVIDDLGGQVLAGFLSRFRHG